MPTQRRQTPRRRRSIPPAERPGAWGGGILGAELLGLAAAAVAAGFVKWLQAGNPPASVACDSEGAAADVPTNAVVEDSESGVTPPVVTPLSPLPPT